MDRTDCMSEKLSSRMVGMILIAVTLVLAVIGFVMLPVFGLFFALPFAILAVAFLAAPESKVCRLILRNDK